MAMSKRQRALKEAEEERSRKWEEHLRLNPPPPPPPWTSQQLSELDKVETMLSELRYCGYEDPEKLSELLQYSGYFEDGLTMAAVRRHFNHYQELKLPSAKSKVWEKINHELYRLSAVVGWVKSSRERGG